MIVEVESIRILPHYTQAVVGWENGGDKIVTYSGSHLYPLNTQQLRTLILLYAEYLPSNPDD